MNTSLGYAKKTLTNSNVLLSGGGDKPLSEFIGSISWDATNRKIKYTPVGGTVTDLVTLSSLAITNYLLPAAKTNALGGIIVSNALTTAVTLTSGNGTTANRYYGIQIDKDGKAFVNIPWTNTWNQNTATLAGYVTAPGENQNGKVWMTGSDGTPSWLNANNHTHNYITSLGNKNASNLPSTYPNGLSVAGIYNNGYPFAYGSTITAKGNGGYFQIAGQWNGAVSSLTDYDYPTEMYIRGRRDSYDVWTTWTRVLTDRNWSSVITLPTKDSWNYDDVYSKLGHKHPYTDLTGSGTTENQAILSNGTANGWKLAKVSLDGHNHNASYVTFVGVTDDNTNHKNLLRYVLNGTSNYFTVPYSTTSGTSAATYFLYARSSALESAGVQFIQGQIKTGSSNNQAYSGSSSNFKVLSFPPNATTINSQGTANESANVAIFRIAWGTKYWHDLHFSPNNNNIYHRVVFNSSPIDWRIVVETTGNKGNSTKPVYVSGGLIYECDAYPTKASWNYDDRYVSSVSISGNYLRINKNGANTDLTIPYATNSNLLNGRISKYYTLIYCYSIHKSVMKVGTATNVAQGGSTLVLRFYTGIGYNADVTQHRSCEVIIRASNGSAGNGGLKFSIQTEGHIGGTFATFYMHLLSDSSYEIWMSAYNYSGWSFYEVVYYDGITYTNNMTAGTLPTSNIIAATNYNISYSDHTHTWDSITSKPAAIGGTTNPVYWNGSGFVEANSYPTKASWNYDDKYVTAVGAGTGSYANQLYYTKNGSNTYFTVPYASNADKLDGWNNTKFCKVYTRAEIGEAPNFDNLKDVDGNQVNGFFESRVNETTNATGKKPPYTFCAPMLSFLNQYVSLQLMGYSGEWYIRGGQSVNVVNANANINWERIVLNSGTWDISITGNAATVTALKNTHKLWGQDFNGTLDVSGNMTGVGTISASGNNTITKTSDDAIFAAVNNNGSVELHASTNRGVYDRTNTKWLIGTNGTNTWLACGNVGIGITSPLYKLDVDGDGRMGHLTIGLDNDNAKGKISPLYFTSSSGGIAEGTAVKITPDLINTNVWFAFRRAVNSSSQPAAYLYTSLENSAINTLQINKTDSTTYNFHVGQGFSSKSGTTILWGYAINFRTRVGGSTSTTHMSITNDGNVGIGTTTPSEKLEVNGNIKATNLLVTKINGVTVGNSPKFTDTTYSNFVKSGSGAAAGLVPKPSTTANTTHYLREDGTWAVPPNTWRGIQNNLTSNSTTDSLSAAQGKVLNGKFANYLPLSGGTMSSGAQITIGSRSNNLGDLYSGGIELRELNYSTTSITDNYVNAPGITFHWGGKWAHKLNLHSNDIFWDNSKIWHAANHGSGSGLNADLLDGYHASSFALASQNLVYYTIDASSLSTLNFYPVTFSPTDMELNCEIHSPNTEASAAYNQNHIHFLLTSCGWSDTPPRFIVLSLGNYDNNEVTIGAVGRGNYGGINCVWVRGGLTYRFRCNLVPTLRSSDYTNSGEKFTVGTLLSGDSNTAVSILWTNEADYRNVTYVTHGIKSTSNIYAVNFYTTSDKSKKQNISEFSEHIRKFQLKDTEKWNYGVIAQEVEEMFREGDDGNMTVNYASILSYYIGLLENKVKALEEKIRILETNNK